MYSLLLVEDERIEMELLEHYVPWKEMDIRVVGTAKNGKEALLRLETFAPDIVLTDVRMPIMDGLEFARRARQLNKDIKIVFLSGHNEFQYIKEALSVEAAGYLLKPIDMEELRDLMEAVKKKCEEDDLIRRNLDTAKERLMTKWLVEKDVDTSRDLADQLFKLSLPLPSHAAYAVAYITLDQAFGSQNQHRYSRLSLIEALQSLVAEDFDYIMAVEFEEQAIGLILMSQDKPFAAADKAYWEKVLHGLSASLDNCRLTIALSDEGQSVEALPGLYRQAKKRNEWKFYLGTGKVITPSDAVETTAVQIKAEGYAAELCRALTLADEPAMKAVIVEFLSRLRQERIRKNGVISHLLGLLGEVEHEFSSLLVNTSGSMLFINHWEQLSLLPSIDELEQYVLEVCSQIIAKIRSRTDTQAQKLLHTITELIQTRFSTSLTVEEIAKEVYLSPNYVRTLYKEAAGETILEAITRYRMQEATKLLANKGMKVHEVARAVGYENVSYFCSVFLKHKGCTPNEYRKKMIW
ncbi:response regulator [Paenibacillus algorifonticola]|uniref:response regulator transcription factor n=1 Tax=Paenibacillus algorifonticola TaxID=684063 RepID=UPI003D2B8BDE